MPLAGLLAAGAFLTKGLIGPIFIALGALPLLVVSKPWKKSADDLQALEKETNRQDAKSAKEEEKTAMSLGGLVALHLAALLAFALPVAAWAGAFWRIGGRELFMEWFWTNHFGRFSGAATQLGHINGPLFYLGALPLYLLPWLPAIAWLLWRAARDRTQWRDLAMPLAWGVGGALLLSCSATKREIYLAPLLPAFALLTAQALRSLTLRPQIVVRYAGVLVGLYFAALLIGEPLVNKHKSYGGAFREFDRQVTAQANLRAAAWDFDETTTAGFYWYADRVFPALTNRAEAVAVLAGKHPQFNALVLVHKGDDQLPKEFANAPATTVPMGARRTLLLLHTTTP